MVTASSPPDCNKLEASPQGEVEEYHPTSVRKKQEINENWTYHNILFSSLEGGPGRKGLTLPLLLRM